MALVQQKSGGRYHNKRRLREQNYGISQLQAQIGSGKQRICEYVHAQYSILLRIDSNERNLISEDQKSGVKI